MTLYADLLAAQKEMPQLQKSGINPHFKNRYVPLEELIHQVVPVLNKHGLMLVQMPTLAEGQPALTTRLIHTSGEAIEATMPLLCAKDDPQGQGSAITYARRYSLMAMLGLTADEDDDAEATRSNGNGLKQYAQQKLQGGAERPATEDGTPERPPVCKTHGAMSYRKAGIAKATGKPYAAFWACTDRNCRTSVNADEWREQQAQFAKARGEVDLDDVPNE